MSEEIGERIGDYEILGILGAGGMGKVYKVRNVISDRIEAMKILLPNLVGRQDLADRFLREIKLLAGLNHPNIAALRTALTQQNRLVMIMEYVEGTTLAARLEQGPMPVADAVNYVDQVLGALSYAHKQHIIHRDIKPGNMMLTPEGVVKLMDFGIARSDTEQGLTRTGTTMGSPYYMAPEQVMGQATDERSDLYSLGVSLYEMVTGDRPFHADSDYSLMAAQVQQPPKPPIEVRAELTAELNQTILTAMAKDPALRFQSADAFREALNDTKGTVPGFSAYSFPSPASTPRPAPPPASATAMGTPSATAIPPRVPTIAPTAPAPPTQESIAPPVEPAPPPFTPVPIPSVLELSSKQQSHRGRYVALGGFLVLVGLVLAGIYEPWRAKIHANDQPVTQQVKPAPEPVNPVVVNPQPNQVPNVTQPPPNPPNGITGNGPLVVNSTPPPTPPHERNIDRPVPHKSPARPDKEVANSDQLEELEQQSDQLSSQASSINASLDNLRRQQSAQGLGLRGDIASAQELMKTHLARAQVALQNRDANGAKKYLDLTESDVEGLQRFLGR